MKRSETLRTFLLLTVFSIAMAYLESAVVVYLRAIMYPEGFDFPLAPMQPGIAVTEIFREAATVIMLLGAGYLGGRYLTQRFAWFIYCFAVWDIFYYVFLKILVNWPASLMTWDILFLIPSTWTGPVITPVIVSLTMILLALVIILHGQKFEKVMIHRREWILLIAGSVILILAFVWDYSAFLLRHYSFGELITLSDKTALMRLSQQYIPAHFPWLLFALGEAVILLAAGLFYRRYGKKRQMENSER
jgi:hypothetical protein